MRDLHNIIDFTSYRQVPQTITDDLVLLIDRQGFEAVEVLYAIGESADALTGGGVTLGFKLEHADDDGAGSPGAFAAVTATDILGFETVTDGVFYTADDSTGSDEEDNTVKCVGYIGGKRHLRATIVATGLSSGVVASMNGILGYPALMPVANNAA